MNEVCPSCGQFVSSLDEQTGWCDECMAILCPSKRCHRCDHVQPLSMFHPHPRAQDGHRGICKPCERERRYQWRLDNPEREAATELRRQLKKKLAIANTAARRLGQSTA